MHPYAAVTEYVYVDQQAQFNELCQDYQTKTVLAIDTEFVRTQTLTPLLGLIQVFDGQQVALIDPVAIPDLSAFAAVLINPDIVKIAHSCSEDLEALWHHLAVIPAPLYDTQFAAALLGIGASIGYANLVEQLFSISLDKGESRTDWMQRPLSTAQLSYAAADVTHLMAIYENIVEQTDAKQQTQWVYQEIAQLGKKKSKPVAANLAYLLLKNAWKLNGRHLAAFKHLTQWRLEVAREHNISVNFVVKEDAIFELATTLPDTTQKLFECRNLYSKPARLYGDKILEICRKAKKLESGAFPSKVQRLIEFSGYKPAMQLLKKLIEEQASQYDIPVASLASKKQLNQVLKWLWFELDEIEAQGLKPDLLCSWRGSLLSSKIQEMLPSLASYHEIKRSL